MTGKQNATVIVVAIVAIAGLETVALLMGINGLVLKGSFAAIGGIAGYVIRLSLKGKDK